MLHTERKHKEQYIGTCLRHELKFFTSERKFLPQENTSFSHPNKDDSRGMFGLAVGKV
jgi:hypothetical protein